MSPSSWTATAAGPRRAACRVALGHKAGAEAARRTIEAAAEQGVGWLTLFAFSSENWLRPAEEVRGADRPAAPLPPLRGRDAWRKEGVRLRVIGDRAPLRRRDHRARSSAAEAATAGGTRLNLTVALSYGGRAEIVAAARAIARGGARRHARPARRWTRPTFAARLFTAGMPDPDLIIRTSGEQRLSQLPAVAGGLCRVRLPGRALAGLRRRSTSAAAHRRLRAGASGATAPGTPAEPRRR